VNSTVEIKLAVYSKRLHEHYFENFFHTELKPWQFEKFNKVSEFWLVF